MSKHLNISLAFAAAGLAAGTTSGTLRITNATPFASDGVVSSKAATDNIPFAVIESGFGATGNGSFTGKTGGSVRLYGVHLDSAGAVSINAGEIASVDGLAAKDVSLQFPAPISDRACIGVVRVQVTAGTTFIPGTTALNAAGVTTTYVNLSSIPGKPLAA